MDSLPIISAHSQNDILVVCALTSQPYVVISITTPGDPRPDFHSGNDPMRRGVLELDFDDADQDRLIHTTSSPDGRSPILFADEYAQQVVSFVRNHKDAIDCIRVHCQAGISRSSAVAAAISKKLLGDDTVFFRAPYRPNMHVYRTLMEAFS